MAIIDDHVITFVDKKMLYIEPQLKAIRAYGLKHNVPIITNDSAAFLRTQVLVAKPLKILEIGTAIGFSGGLMLLNSQAHLTTIEISEVNFDLAQTHFKDLSLSDRVTQYLGDASDVLQTLISASKSFDFVFIDAAKGQYLDYFMKAEKLIEPGGVMLTDNVLYKGIVCGHPHPRRNKTIVTRLNALIDYVTNHEDYHTSLLSIGDGMLLSVRKDKV